jgi:hypothetical protein
VKIVDNPGGREETFVEFLIGDAHPGVAELGRPLARLESPVAFHPCKTPYGDKSQGVVDNFSASGFSPLVS